MARNFDKLSVGNPENRYNNDKRRASFKNGAGLCYPGATEVAVVRGEEDKHTGVVNGAREVFCPRFSRVDRRSGRLNHCQARDLPCILDRVGSIRNPKNN